MKEVITVRLAARPYRIGDESEIAFTLGIGRKRA